MIFNSKSFLFNPLRKTMDIQYAFAVIFIILGVGLSQSGDSNPFYAGLGVGLVAMGSLWVAIRLIKELKKKELK